MKPGLDPSWAYALNVLPHTGFIFGRDVVHTYGPLGFLLEPLNVGSNLVVATAFRLLTQGIFAACLLKVVLRASRVLPTLAFTGGYLMAMVAVIDLDYSYQLIVLESLLVLLSFSDSKLWLFATSTAGVLAASLLFMKFGIGILALAIYISVTLCSLLTGKHRVLKVVIAAVGSYFFAFIIFAALSLRSIPNVVAWITHSMDMCDGLQIAHSSGGSRLFLAFAVGSAIVYTVITFCFFRWKIELRYVLAAFVPAIFLTFKHGFVRADGHERNFFPFVLALISVFILFVASRKEFLALVIGYGLVLALSVPVGIHYGREYQLPSPLVTLTGKKGLSNIIEMADFSRTQRMLDLQSAANFRTNQLPEIWIDEIRKYHWTVDVIPWELTYVFENHLTWDPEPTLQSFMVFTPALDEWSAQHFDSNKGPDVLIVEFLAIDGRNLLLDAPAVTRSVLWNYEPYKEDVDRNLFLLKRRPNPVAKDLVALTQREIRAGAWIDVPDSDRAVFADLKLSLSFFGRIVKTLYRIPEVDVALVYQSGREQSYRITPGTARDGLLLNYLPTIPSEFSDILHNRKTDKVVKFKLFGPGVKYYNPNVYLEWQQAKGPGSLSELCVTRIQMAKGFGMEKKQILMFTPPFLPSSK